MRPDRAFDQARRIARVMLGGATDEAALRERMTLSFHPATPWLVALAAKLVGNAPAAAWNESKLAAALLDEPEFDHALHSHGLPRCVRPPLHAEPTPSKRLSVDGLPRLESPQQLADWLGVAPGRLAWLADPFAQEARRADGPLRHYRYAWRAREYGPDRLIEMPKRELRDIQRRLHDAILAHAPIHACAHGFVRGRSPLTHARVHAGQRAVLRVDLAQFFTSIDAARVRGVFRLLGFAPEVAVLLAGLSTNSVPGDVLASAPHGPLPWEDRQRLRHAHLPQGAPSSPMLANLVAWRLDVRLAAWAARRGLAYSRYADDLTFSGDVDATSLHRFASRIAVIVEDSGFRVNHRKTRCFGAHRAQRVTGLVVNRHPNIARAEFDRLKAILTNCIRNGPAGENRENRADFRAFLQGRVAWCTSVNPARGARLARLFARIDWS